MTMSSCLVLSRLASCRVVSRRVISSRRVSSRLLCPVARDVAVAKTVVLGGAARRTSPQTKWQGERKEEMIMGNANESA